MPFLAGMLSTPDGRGARWCARSDQYVIVRQRLGDGDSLGAVRGALQPLPVTAEDRHRVAQRHEGQWPGVPFDQGRLPRVKPILERLHVDDRDRLWVRVTSPDDSARFEVWSPEGRLLARAVATHPFVPYLPVIIAGDRAYGVVQDQDDVPYVVRARVVR